jgi:ABC-type nitrate/sulfonate/bicarbonate transport system substrate-binding protein
VDRIRFPYRSPIHLQLLHVVAHTGAWEKYGLDVEYDMAIKADAAHDAVMNGDVEFVGGNHVSPYGYRARGDRWIYIGQTVNVVPGRKLVVRPDSAINSLADLREKVVGTRGSHPSLNDWLQLKQHGLDVDRDEVVLLDPNKSRGSEDERPPLWMDVRDGNVDAAILPVPQGFFAKRAGLKVIDVPVFPMIYFTTISSSLSFVEKHPDIVERFLKGMMEGIHFFKTQPEKTAQILKERYHSNNGEMDDDIARETQACLAAALEADLYPRPDAIANVYEEGKRKDKDAERINPMALWDLHYLRKIEDSGFLTELYEPAPVTA